MFWNRLQGPELKSAAMEMVQAHSNGCLDQGSFGGGVRREVRFCALPKVVSRRTPKCVGLSSWKDGVIYLDGGVCGRMFGCWDRSLVSDMLS